MGKNRNHVRDSSSVIIDSSGSKVPATGTGASSKPPPSFFKDEFNRNMNYMTTKVFTANNIFYTIVFLTLFFLMFYIVRISLESLGSGIQESLVSITKPVLASSPTGFSIMGTPMSTPTEVAENNIHCLTLLILEVILWSSFLIYTFSVYHRTKDDASTYDELSSYVKHHLFDLSSLIGLVVFIFIFYGILLLTGTPFINTSSKSFTVMMFEMLIWASFTILFSANVLNFLFGVNFSRQFSNYLSSSSDSPRDKKFKSIIPPDWNDAKVDDFRTYLLTYPADYPVEGVYQNYIASYGTNAYNEPGKSFTDNFGVGYGGATFASSNNITNSGTEQTAVVAEHFQSKISKTKSTFSELDSIIENMNSVEHGFGSLHGKYDWIKI